jgi:glycerophosphoryl diester phosphodiesterase
MWLAPIVLVLGIALSLSAAAQTAEERPTRAALDLQGHRGARGLHPENTLEGFRESLAMGVTTLEMDAGITSDGVVVVHHDERLSPYIARSAKGRWIDSPTPALRELTWAQLEAYDVGRYRPGSPNAARFPEVQGRDGVRVPRLADVVAEAERLCAGEIFYNVETKLTPAAPELTVLPAAFADAVVRVMRESGVAPRTMIQSFDWRTLRHIQQVAPELETACLTREVKEDDTIQRGRPGSSPWTAGLDVDDFAGSVPRLVKASGCRVWSPRFEDLAAGEVALSHELGIRVIPWTVNEPAKIAAALDLEVDGIISDHPDRVRAEMQSRGMPLPPACPLLAE